LRQAEAAGHADPASATASTGPAVDFDALSDDDLIDFVLHQRGRPTPAPPSDGEETHAD